MTFSGRGGLAWGLGMCLSLALALGLAFGPGPRLGSGPGPGPGSGLCVWAFLLGLALAPGGRQPAQASPAHYRQTSRPTRCIIHFSQLGGCAVSQYNLLIGQAVCLSARNMATYISPSVLCSRWACNIEAPVLYSGEMFKPNG